MQNILSQILVIAVVVAGLVGCQTAQPGGRLGSDTVPLLSADKANAAGISTEEVSVANSLFVAKCAKCHKFYHPVDYSRSEWDGWMRKMSRKARLKPEQEELLTRYLAAFRDEKEAPAPK